MVLHLKITILLLHFLLFVRLSLYAQQPSGGADLWEKGIEAKENGNYSEALRYWKQAKQSDRKPDPRIGMSYIELATDQKLKEHYQEASRMYIWGLSNCEGDYKKELETEFERVRPIVREDTYKQWKRFMKKDDVAAACESLINFWEVVDPTVTTDYNERLIEHWERIAYSRQNFTRGRSSVYDADERAIVYVKLGKPDRIRKGTLHFNSSLVRGWAYDGMELHATGISTGGGGFSRGGGGGGGGGDTDSTAGTNEFQQSQFGMERLVKDIMAENILRKARLVHRYPYYEIWVYKNMVTRTGDNVIYIFGEDGDTGEFGMQSSLEEMIPNSAFRTSFVDRSPISPGYLLQMLFYEQTSIADEYFADAFNELQSSLLTLSRFNSKASSFAIRSRKASQLRYRQYQAPQERSTYLEEIPNISLETYQYRMLDKNNQPYLATFVESQPQKAFYIDQLKQQDFNLSAYRLFHYIKMADEENDVLAKQSRSSRIFLEGTGNVDDMQKSSAYFKIPNHSEGIHQVFTVELQNLNTDSLSMGEDVFPENIRAIGKIENSQPQPLIESFNELEVSDVLIGVDEGTEELNYSGPTTFRVLHDRVIPANQNMMIHFEVYNLTSRDPDPNRFMVEYQVIKKGRNFLSRLFGGSSEKVKLTLNFETTENRYVNDLEIATSPFEAGEYQLVLKISEPGNDRVVEREVDFVITDEE